MDKALERGAKENVNFLSVINKPILFNDSVILLILIYHIIVEFLDFEQKLVSKQYENNNRN